MRKDQSPISNGSKPLAVSIYEYKLADAFKPITL